MCCQTVCVSQLQGAQSLTHMFATCIVIREACTHSVRGSRARACLAQVSETSTYRMSSTRRTFTRTRANITWRVSARTRHVEQGENGTEREREGERARERHRESAQERERDRVIRHPMSYGSAASTTVSRGSIASLTLSRRTGQTVARSHAYAQTCSLIHSLPLYSLPPPFHTLCLLSRAHTHTHMFLPLSRSHAYPPSPHPDSPHTHAYHRFMMGHL